MSSLIHAATLVLAGVILLDRSKLDSVPVIFILLVLLSVVSGSILASCQLDVKRALAYSTTAHISLCAVPGLLGSHLSVHAYFKSGSFMLITAVFQSG